MNRDVYLTNEQIININNWMDEFEKLTDEEKTNRAKGWLIQAFQIQNLSHDLADKTKEYLKYKKERDEILKSQSSECNLM
jgi:hypothetical protein